MQYGFEAIKEKIDSTLQSDILDVGFRPAALYEPIQYTLASGGKRLRPVLLVMAYNLFQEDIAPAIKPAIGLEILHNFTLLHDDIMDNSPMRRGKATVHKKWDANTAILSGDAMFIKAYQFLVAGRPQQIHDVLGVFNRISLQVCEGQQYDMDFEQAATVNEDEYLEMIALKTSALLAGGLQIGALLGNADKTTAQQLHDFGMNLGLAFQLQDDYLDSFGDPEVFGKRIGGDILAAKKTFLLIKAFEKAQPQQKEKINTTLADKNRDDKAKIDAVIQHYKSLKIDTLVQERIDHYYRQASESLDAVAVADEKKTSLRQVAEKLLRRIA